MKRKKQNQTPTDVISEKTMETIRRFSMFTPGETVVAGVSGGPDSTALALMLKMLNEELKINLHIAHLNHSIRAESADLEALFVEDLAKKLNLPYHYEKADVPEIRKSKKTSLEAAAREARYDFLKRIAENVGASKIAVGHNADDRVETFFLNMARGSGSKGLAALSPVQNNIVRPLISVWRQEIINFLNAVGQEYVIDESNESLEFARNRIRHIILPFLEKEYPGICKRIWTLCEIISAEAETLNEAVDKTLNSATILREPGKLVLGIPKILAKSLAMQRLVIRRAIASLQGDLKDIGFCQIERIIQKIANPEDFEIVIPTGRISIRKRGSELIFLVNEGSIEKNHFTFNLPVPGKAEIEGVGKISIDFWDKSDFIREKQAKEAVFDADTIIGSLQVRNWQEGDRMQPLGMRSERKLQDIFTDLKVPIRKRHKLPVITDDEKIIWIAGIALSDLVKITNGTRTALKIQWEPE